MESEVFLILILYIVCGNILLFCQIECTKFASYYGNHTLTSSTSIIFLSLFSHSIDRLCVAPCLLAQPF